MDAASDRPSVSVLVVVRNGQKVIGRCLDSLLAQDYPKDRYEIIVVDGASEDGTRGVVEERRTEIPQFRLLDNPRRTLAAGWNLGLESARADYVVRLDAHAVASPDFLRTSVETMLATADAACVGGSMETRHTTWLGQAISEVLSSPFGVGNSKFRTSKRAQYVDTVAYGLYRRQVLLDVGGLNEEMKRNQDLELHSRIRRAGWRFYLNPAIHTAYYARDSFRSFVAQAWQNGWWNIITFLKDPRAVSLRHLVPLGFVLFLLATGLGGALWRPLWHAAAAAGGLYLLLALVASARGAGSPWFVAVKPVLFLSLHGSYGAGSLACALYGLPCRLLGRRSLEETLSSNRVSG
jgi:cellulose synthase/poly-beta-1,6-N-acetylglucosamine synthase-like glycosyltransferase